MIRLYDQVIVKGRPRVGIAVSFSDGDTRLDVKHTSGTVHVRWSDWDSPSGTEYELETDVPLHLLEVMYSYLMILPSIGLVPMDSLIGGYFASDDPSDVIKEANLAAGRGYTYFIEVRQGGSDMIEWIASRVLLAPDRAHYAMDLHELDYEGVISL